MRNLIFKIGFGLMVLVQIAVPVTMLIGTQRVVDEGTLYKFRTRPRDPNDPFRGKYIALSHDINRADVLDKDGWEGLEYGNLLLEKDAEGFAVPRFVTPGLPDERADYVRVQLRGLPNDDMQISFELPFDRYYMDEEKAPAAEIFYRNMMRDTTKDVYSLVSIKDGEAVLQGVYVDSVRLEDLVELNQ